MPFGGRCACNLKRSSIVLRVVADMHARCLSVAGLSLSLAALPSEASGSRVAVCSSAFLHNRHQQSQQSHASSCKRRLGTYNTAAASSVSSSDDDRTKYGTQHKIASSIAKGERRARDRRGKSRELCNGCKRPPNLCVCSVLRSVLPQYNEGGVIKLKTQSTNVLILQHPNEFRKRNFSTVPLVGLVLQDVTTKVGYDFNSEALLDSLGIYGGASMQKPLLLFPDDGAIDLDEYVRQQQYEENGKDKRETNSDVILDEESLPSSSSKQQRNLLILIDGTWREAKRMAKNSPNLLQRCQMVQFPPSDIDNSNNSNIVESDNIDREKEKHQSVYNAVRKEPEAHTISTLEALANALEVLEPESGGNHATTKPSVRLRRVLEKHVEAYLFNAVSSRAPRFNRDRSGIGARNKRTWQIKKDIFTNEDISADAATASDKGIRSLADGCIIRPLQLADAPQLYAWWDHKSSNSLQMVARCISSDRNANIGACLGVFEPEKDKLRAGIVRYEGGAVGMLHVDSQHRRRGYGVALLSEATKAIEKACVGECVAFIMEGNIASEKTFEKIGWVREDPSLKKGSGKRRANRKWIKRNS